MHYSHQTLLLSPGSGLDCPVRKGYRIHQRMDLSLSVASLLTNVRIKRLNKLSSVVVFSLSLLIVPYFSLGSRGRELSLRSFSYACNRRFTQWGSISSRSDLIMSSDLTTL